MTHTHPQGTSGGDTRPLVIGLTGGIGSGKTTVANYFAELGITVIDADQLAREVVMPGTPALEAIAALFGPSALNPDDTLDRTYIRTDIFSNPLHKQQLEDLLHPLIRQRMQALLAAATGPYCIAVIPLLLETAQTDLVDRVLVVDNNEIEQRKRVAERDGLSNNAINDIIATQASRATRLSAASDIITNDLDRESLRNKVHELHQHYLVLANADKF